MIQGNYEPHAGYQPRCFDVAYTTTKEALRRGMYFSISQCKHLIKDQWDFLWLDEELLEQGIKQALKEDGKL